MLLIAALIFAGAGASPMLVSSQTHRPEHLRQCFVSRVKWVGTRLVDGPDQRPVPDSGSAIQLLDGHYGVSYDHVAGIDASRRGDRVKLCVVQLPRHCPQGDTRGIDYRWSNLRTGQSWRAVDAEHGCGGA